MQIVEQVAGWLQPFDSEQLTVTTASLPLTASKYSPDPSAAAAAGLTKDGSRARLATITVDGAIRYTVDGTVPSATLGHRVDDGGSFDIANYSALTKLRMWRDTSQSSDSTIYVTYWR